jgi:hypothetical protein
MGQQQMRLAGIAQRVTTTILLLPLLSSSPRRGWFRDKGAQCQRGRNRYGGFGCHR